MCETQSWANATDAVRASSVTQASVQYSSSVYIWMPGL